MGTPFIGQHDKAQVSTILFLCWANFTLMLMIIAFLIMWTKTY
jgi:hypothetical protein